MFDVKLLAELMLQLSIYFESDTDDVAEWLTTNNKKLYNCRPIDLIWHDNLIDEVHKCVMKEMT